MKRSKYSFHDFSAKHTPSATLKHIILNHPAHLCFINSDIVSVLPFDNIFSVNFRSVPGEHFRFCPVQCARNCINLHLFIDVIHYCCNHMTPLVHFTTMPKFILLQMYGAHFLTVAAQILTWQGRHVKRPRENPDVT